MKLNNLTEIAKLAIITFIIYSVTKLFGQFKDFKLPEFKLPKVEMPKLPKVEMPKTVHHTTTHKHVDIRELHKQHPAIAMPVPSERGMKMINYLKKTKIENLPPNLRILKQIVK